MSVSTERCLLYISRYPNHKASVCRSKVLSNARKSADSSWILTTVNRTVTQFKEIWYHVPYYRESYNPILRRFYEFLNKFLFTKRFHFLYILSTAALKSRMLQSTMQYEMSHFNVLTLQKSNFHFSWFKVILKFCAPHSSTWNYTSTHTYAFMASTGTFHPDLPTVD